MTDKSTKQTDADILRAAVKTTEEAEVNGKKITLQLPQDLAPYVKMREAVFGGLELDEEGNPKGNMVGGKFKVAVIGLAAMVDGLEEGEAAAILSALGGEDAELTNKIVRLTGFDRFFPVDGEDEEGDELDPT